MKNFLGYFRTKEFKRCIAELSLGVFVISIMNPSAVIADNNIQANDVVYPLKQISKLDCRFADFSQLNSDCKQDLQILLPSDYPKYAHDNGGYNLFTRIYTVLWGASYKYGWDVGNGGHIGTDIATAKGTPVYSTANGTVVIAEAQNELGNLITIEHNFNGKKVFSTYGHLSKIDVTKGQTVSAGTKIGEVGSTGNATGNHLHFQIDLDTAFHPYYYNYKTCPYSYYQITEQGMCFNELSQNTLDPLLFLETKGKILDNIQVTTVARSTFTTTGVNATLPGGLSYSSTPTNATIFDRTVYVGYPVEDIKTVQKIFKDMGVYKGDITGKYEDVESSILAYQISKGIVQNSTETGAGYFGPKTRTQAKSDYTQYLALHPETTSALATTNTQLASNVAPQVSVANTIVTQKISKDNLLTREEIEAREVKDFINQYKVSLTLREAGGNVKLGETIYIDLEVKDNRGRYFVGNMPSGMTFMVDGSKVDVFPQKLFNFTDGKREIKITGLQLGDTNLYIKIGNETVKTIPIKVYDKVGTIVPDKGAMLGVTTAILGDKQTGIILFKDKGGRNLVNLPYASDFQLKTSPDVNICIKSGNLVDIKKVYTSKCRDEDFKPNPTFSYKNTIAGLLIFDYKVSGKNAKIELVNTSTKNKSLDVKAIGVSNPKDLDPSYAYNTEVLKMLGEGVVDGLNKGYFLGNKEITQYDALSWIRNALIKMNNDPLYAKSKPQIEKNLKEVYNKRLSASTANTVTRKDLLSLTYSYLLFDKSNIQITKKYLDLDLETNKQANAVFVVSTTWKDKFGENYFVPDAKATRGETTYLLSNIFDKNKEIFLTMR